MSPVTPTPPVSSTDASLPESMSAFQTSDARTLDATKPTRRVSPGRSFRNSRWRPAICCAGALVIGVSLAPLLLTPQSDLKVGESEVYTPAEIVLPSESTLVVVPTLPPGALLRGQIRLVADVTGKAPVSGQVARHLVENGARVRRGDAVLEISSGGQTRSVLPSELRQNRAEQGQIAAADAQNALAAKVNAAQGRLRDAQERVSRSQAQIAVARDIVRRLQNGAVVSPAELPALFRGPGPQIEPFRPGQAKKRRVRRGSERGTSIPSSARADDRPSNVRAESENRIALRQSQAAREAAREGARDLQTAQKTLAEAQSSVRDAEKKLQNATKNVADVETRFGAKKASGADVEAARSAQSEAQQALGSAGKAVVASKAEVSRREASAKSSQIYADSAGVQAAKALSAARLDLPGNVPDGEDSGSQKGADIPEEATNSDSGERNSSNNDVSPARVTLDQAIRFAGAALDESRRASRDAERIHAQIEGYQNQVTSSRSRVESATQDLVSAQQKVLDSAPRPRFTASYAPADGVVMWISRLAREVGAGQAVFGVARGEKVVAHFEDNSGLWRTVKKDGTLPAFVVDASDAKLPGQPIPNSKTASGAKPSMPNTSSLAMPGDLATGGGFPAQVKITAIETPSKSGAPAILTAEVRAAPGTGSVGTGSVAPFRAGAGVLIPMPLPAQKATLSVPASALVKWGNQTYLAVLSPVADNLAAAKTGDSLPPNSTKNEGTGS